MSRPESKRPADPVYAFGLLGEAVYELATGRGRINERLLDAFTRIHRARPDDFPKMLRGDFMWIMDKFRSLGVLQGEDGEIVVSRIESALSAMDEKLAVEIARHVIALESRLGPHLDPEES
jgi:hypothetical protein